MKTTITIEELDEGYVIETIRVPTERDEGFLGIFNVKVETKAVRRTIPEVSAYVGNELEDSARQRKDRAEKKKTKAGSS